MGMHAEDKKLKKIHNWWVSCPRFTCLVMVRDHKIVGGAPIIKKWIGKRFKDFLIRCQVDRLCLLKMGDNDEKGNRI